MPILPKFTSHHSRSTSQVPAAQSQVLLQGWVYLGSAVVDNVFVRRWVELHADCLLAFKGQDLAESKKAVVLSHNCTVSSPTCSNVAIRQSGTNTLLAVAKGSLEHANKWTFTISNPKQKTFRRCMVALNSEDDAIAWRQKLEDTIASLAPTAAAGGHDMEHGASIGAKSALDSEADDLASLPQRSTRLDFHSFSTEPTAFDDALPSSSNTIEHIVHELRTLNNQDVQQQRWKPVRHVNGVAVYQEQAQAGSNGASMASAIVRASPLDVFMALMQTNHNFSALWSLQEITVLEELDDYNMVFHAKVEPIDGWASSCFRARDVVMKRTWWRQDNGTYNVLFMSVDHPAAPVHDVPWYQPGGVTRAKVASAGFTIAPLRVEELKRYGRGYQTHESSPECLVTMVLQVDLGGMLSSNGWLHPAMAYCGVHDAFISHILMSVVAIRDMVESQRFVESTQSIGLTPAVPKAQPLPLVSDTRRPSMFVATEKVAATVQPLPVHAAAQTPMVQQNAKDLIFLPRHYFECPGASVFKVRGPTYLKDSKKYPAPPPMFDLVGLELLEVDRHVDHISPYLPAVQQNAAPFVFTVNLLIPWKPPLHLVVIFSADMSAEDLSSHDFDDDENLAPFDLVLARFLAGDDAAADARRDATFKLIPCVMSGSWIVRQSVGTKPVLLGNKLRTKYSRGPGYFEVAIDVTSNGAASSVTQMVGGTLTKLVIDLGFVLEGKSPEELPEFLLGTVRLNHLEMKAAHKLDTSHPVVPTPKRVPTHSRAHSRHSSVSTRSTTQVADTGTPRSVDALLQAHHMDAMLQSNGMPREMRKIDSYAGLPGTEVKAAKPARLTHRRSQSVDTMMHHPD